MARSHLDQSKTDPRVPTFIALGPQCPVACSSIIMGASLDTTRYMELTSLRPLASHALRVAWDSDAYWGKNCVNSCRFTTGTRTRCTFDGRHGANTRTDRCQKSGVMVMPQMELSLGQTYSRLFTPGNQPYSFGRFRLYDALEQQAVSSHPLPIG